MSTVAFSPTITDETQRLNDAWFGACTFSATEAAWDRVLRRYIAASAWLAPRTPAVETHIVAAFATVQPEPIVAVKILPHTPPPTCLIPDCAPCRPVRAEAAVAVIVLIPLGATVPAEAAEPAPDARITNHAHASADLGEIVASGTCEEQAEPRHIASFALCKRPMSMTIGTLEVECRSATPTSLRCTPSPRSPRPAASARGFAAMRHASASPAATRPPHTEPAAAPGFFARCITSCLALDRRDVLRA